MSSVRKLFIYEKPSPENPDVLHYAVAARLYRKKRRAWPLVIFTPFTFDQNEARYWQNQLTDEAVNLLINAQNPPQFHWKEEDRAKILATDNDGGLEIDHS